MGTGFALSDEIKIWICIREFTASSKYQDGSPSMIFGSSWGTSDVPSMIVDSSWGTLDEKRGCKASWQRESMFNLIKSIWSN
jgi:hypothetical protein